MNRRTFAQSLSAGLTAAALPEFARAAEKKLKIGYTALSWNATPRAPENLEAALKDFADLGFHSFETFAEVLETHDTNGTLSGLIAKYKVPLRSGYLTTNVIDPAQRKETTQKVTRLSNIIKKHGGTFIVLAPNSVKREEFKFAEHKSNIVAALNEYAKAANDAGLGTGLHQHTGTAVDSEQEVYTIMNAVDTRHCKFAPDVGQLQKGGADAAKVVKDFLPILVHMHLKDFVGGEYFAGYCPLGQGKVDIPGILNMVEGAGAKANIMVELDRAPSTPISALDTAKTSKAYLVKLGYQFKS
jgi:inosose dehydratase